uniref:Uncharacterized protein n=1 Tax=Rhizophora mucronata TaxID=61149 RepID=A0A2P2R4F1_RHIMU
MDHIYHIDLYSIIQVFHITACHINLVFP